MNIMKNGFGRHLHTFSHEYNEERIWLLYTGIIS
jgi:hypothetical protein